MNRERVFSVVTMLLVVSSASWATSDGVGLYKTKCAGCHGAMVTANLQSSPPPSKERRWK
jgi:hypothetical protein